ncbi:MAG TPA: hypothetical protein VKQ27_20210 [Acetobacteraceae bacterium]|nr:hypothetical protein [Acetobacteraceae bacterium]
MLMALIGLIPGALTVIEGIIGLQKDAQVKITMAKLGCDRDTAIAKVNALRDMDHDGVSRLQIIASSKALVFLLLCFALPIAAYDAKVIIWDVMLGWGSTDAIKGVVAEHMNTVMIGIFGAAGAMGAASLWGRK